MRWMFVVGVKMEGSRRCCGDLLNPDISVISFMWVESHGSCFMSDLSRSRGPERVAARAEFFPVSECRRGNGSQIKHTVNE